ncbi:MAG: arsenate reductase ArsC [Anaerolineales bacterium]|nr:arsenate reductase ArsC [Anaerolineales bacterium]
MNKKKVLILCTGNSCRSQMAEALINQQLGDLWDAYSAGTDPAGYVHPLAVKVLGEVGIEWEGESKHIGALPDVDWDLMITVCGDAAENCPVWLGKGSRHHIGFIDPAKAEGSEEEVESVFRDVREQIADQVLGFLHEQE